MRHVRKRGAPPELTTYRAQPGARYDGDSGFPPVKKAIREALVAEQHGLCCYCNQRIHPAEQGMRIEHRVPQSVDPARDLDWRNLLGACCGNEGPGETHCDVAKGDQQITLDPAQESHVATTTFTSEARLTSTREGFRRDIDDVLRLNCELLVERRQRALDAYIEARTARYTGTMKRETFARWLDELDAVPEGHALPPFASYLRWWLARKVRRSAPGA